MVNDLRSSLVAAGETPTWCAWFRVVDAEIVRADQGERHDTASQRSQGPGYGVVSVLHADRLRPRIDMGNHAAIAVTPSRVSVWADRSPLVLGRLLATYRRGHFRGDYEVSGERVELTLEDDLNGPLYVVGTWSASHDECLVTARAAVDVAHDVT